MENINKVIFITGCGNGLGLAMANEFSKREDFNLVITARKSSLDFLKNKFSNFKNVLIKEIDLTSPYNFKKVIDDVYSKFGKIDVLINNAAICYRAVLEHVEDENEKILMQTNYFGPRELLRYIVPNMKINGGGKIINISSVGGMMAMPTMSSYSASKFAMEGMSESLWYELRPFKISVTLVQIGFINSDSFKKVVVSEKAKNLEKDSIYQYYYTGMETFIHRIMKLSRTTPESVSKIILDKIILEKNPPLRVLASTDSFFFHIFRKLMPQQLYHYVLYHMLPSSFKIKIKEFLHFIKK